MVKKFKMYIVTTLKGIANMIIDQLMIQFLEVHIRNNLSRQLFINGTYQAFLLKIDM